MCVQEESVYTHAVSPTSAETELEHWPSRSCVHQKPWLKPYDETFLVLMDSQTLTPCFALLSISDTKLGNDVLPFTIFNHKKGSKSDRVNIQATTNSKTGSNAVVVHTSSRRAQPVGPRGRRKSELTLPPKGSATPHGPAPPQTPASRGQSSWSWH